MTTEIQELKAEIAKLREEIAALRAERVVHHYHHQIAQPLYTPAPYVPYLVGDPRRPRSPTSTPPQPL